MIVRGADAIGDVADGDGPEAAGHQLEEIAKFERTPPDPEIGEDRLVEYRHPGGDEAVRGAEQQRQRRDDHPGIVAPDPASGKRARRHQSATLIPPSMLIICPVMKRARGEASSVMKSPMSCGWPT